MYNITRCTRCIMSNDGDPTITFNNAGQCSYCTDALNLMPKVYMPNNEGVRLLEKKLETIKAKGKGHKYDCIMGVSGGLDSSYLAYLGHKWGLRVLAVHIDDGYDTEISKSNIKKLIEKTGFDYTVIEPDAKQFNGLIKAYMKAGVPNIAIPQDSVLFAFLYDKALEYKIPYFLSGENFSTECILQKGNTYRYTDSINIKSINDTFGSEALDKLKFITTAKKSFLYRTGILKSERLLNLVDYNRDNAFKELYDFCGFEYYGRKHLENIYTAFLQLYWLPKKFGVDKRTSHLSSMIISNQLTREEALAEFNEPLYDEKMMRDYIEFICDKIGISDSEFIEIMNNPNHRHEDFKTENDTFIFKFYSKAARVIHMRD